MGRNFPRSDVNDDGKHEDDRLMPMEDVLLKNFPCSSLMSTDLTKSGRDDLVEDTDHVFEDLCVMNSKMTRNNEEIDASSSLWWGGSLMAQAPYNGALLACELTSGQI